MRHGILALTLCTVLLASTASANLLENGDFSDWTSPIEPTGWIVEDTALARVERSSDPARSTPYAVKLTRLVAGTGSNQGIRQQFIPLQPGNPYTLTAWFYDDDLDAGGGIGISYYDAGTTYVSHSGTAYTDSSIHTWQRVQKIDTVPAGAALGRITLRVYGFTGSQPGGVVYVDDAELVEGVGIAELPGPVIRPGAVIAAEPNPSPGRTTVALELVKAGDVRVDLYDMTGSQRASIFEGRLEAGTHTLPWNGKDEHGLLLPSGLYFAVLNDSAGNQTVCKLVLRH